MNGESNTFRKSITSTDSEEVKIMSDEDSIEAEDFVEPSEEKTCKFERLCSEIWLDITISYDDIGKWLAEQFRSYFSVPKGYLVNYEISLKKSDEKGSGISCTIYSSFPPVTRVLVESIGKSKEHGPVLVREVANMGHLLDAGFEIRFRYFDEIINSDMKNIRYALYGDISKMVRECDQLA